MLNSNINIIFKKALWIFVTFLASELEPLVDDRSNHEKAREELNSEYKKKFKPFSHYQYVNGRFSSKRGVAEIRNVHKDFSTDLDNDASWYREVVELRKKAGEYKVRPIQYKMT